eukprot:7414063-Heterocapsa_arctica.AAC.1
MTLAHASAVDASGVTSWRSSPRPATGATAATAPASRERLPEEPPARRAGSARIVRASSCMSRPSCTALQSSAG